jgi:uncharacterized secreted protein with C-terminal beta-propeller domain
MDEERRERVQRNLGQDRRAWVAAHKREFQRTGIVEFAVRNPQSETPSVETEDVGTVPGRPLNQFSIDEHEGNLRIATTVDPPIGGESENDVYVLDDSLSVVGSVTGMGVTERIYSVRFVGDEAYVVTSGGSTRSTSSTSRTPPTRRWRASSSSPATPPTSTRSARTACSASARRTAG